MKKGMILFLSIIIVILLAVLVIIFNQTQNTKENRLEKVIVQAGWILNGEFAPIAVAIEKGYYEEEGIEVETRPGGPSGASFLVSTSLVAQDTNIDIAIDNDIVTLLSGLGQADEQNEFNVKLIGALWQDNPMGFIVRKDSGLKSIKDFGKTKPDGTKYKIGTTEGTIILEPMAQYIGVPLNELEIVQTSFDASPFLAGQVDALFGFWTTQAYEVEKAGIEYEFLLASEIPGLVQPCLSIIASEKTIREKPEMLERWMRATFKGVQYTIDNPEEAAQYVVKDNFGGKMLDLEQETWIVKKSLPLFKFDDSYEKIGYLDEQKIISFAETLYDFNFVHKKLSSSDIMNFKILEKVYK